MNTMIVTTTQTATRMAVIENRTGSALMAGAKAMMIQQLKDQMRKGVAHFSFLKKNGEVREAFGTTNRAVAQKHTLGTGESRERYSTTAYFDIEKGQWRSFRWESIIAVY